jgi:hypothetical protein
MRDRMIGLWVALSFIFVLVVALTDPFVEAGDRFELVAPNGVSFGAIKGYETWQVIAPSYRTDKNELRVMLGNQIMIDAYRKGVPQNGSPFPDGAIIVKIGYSERKSSAFPAAIEPDVLQRLEYMVKDSKRFSETGGWGYARFVYDAKTDTFKAYGKEPTFDRECHQCHLLVKDRDFVFTGYPRR